MRKCHLRKYRVSVTISQSVHGYAVPSRAERRSEAALVLVMMFRYKSSALITLCVSALVAVILYYYGFSNVLL